MIRFDATTKEPTVTTGLLPALHAHSVHSNTRVRVIHLADGDRTLCGKRVDADRTAALRTGDGITTRFDRPCAKCHESAA